MGRSAVLGAALLAVACGGEPAPPAGVAEPPAIALTAELRIDGYEHDLVPIGWLGVSSAGVLTFVQTQDFVIRSFDASSGAPLGVVGGEGQGPGEFLHPVRGGWLGDSLWIHDANNGRISVISPEMEVTRELRPADAAGPHTGSDGQTRSFARPFPYALYPGDVTLVSALSVTNGPPLPAWSGYPILRIGPDGAVLAEVARASPTDGSYVTLPSANGGAVVGVIPFYAVPVWSVAADGSRLAQLDLASDGSTFRVRVVDAMGDSVFDRTYPVQPVPIPAAVMDSAIEANVERREPSRRADMAALIRAEVPTHHPPARDVIVGSDGRIWVRLRDVPEGRSWVVLSGSGDPVGRITLQVGSDLRVADETWLWTVEQDELGVGSVVRYRMGDATGGVSRGGG